MDPDVRLFKRNILIVEDEYIQAFDYRNELLDRGAEVTGPIATVEDAIERVRQSSPIDAAVVDLNLGGEFSYPLVDELVKRDVPVLFASAYGAEVLPYRFRHIPRCQKPLRANELADAVAEIIVDARRADSNSSD